jgi:endonuclease/exonuclease/phosphatase (EEP) superfamily protein YafD
VTPTREKWARRIAAGVAAGYSVALVLVWALLRLVGESWWVTTVGLYLPRLVLAAPLPVVAGALLMLKMRRWLWTQAAAAWLLLFPVLGFVLPGWRRGDGSAPRVRLLTCNINSALAGVEAVVAEVEQHQPDVVLLQEIGHPDQLEAALHLRFPTVEVSGQFALASRFAIQSKADPPKLPYYGQARSPRYLQRVLETPLGPIAFYNVHPVSPREDFAALRGHGLRGELFTGRLFSGGSASLIGANAGLRELQVQSFAEAARAESAPVVIAGDTNLPGLSKIFGRHLASFQDAFESAGWGLGYTYPNDRKPWMRIDRILASEQLRFVGFEVGKSQASDHLCVAAELQRRAP